MPSLVKLARAANVPRVAEPWRREVASTVMLPAMATLGAAAVPSATLDWAVRLRPPAKPPSIVSRPALAEPVTWIMPVPPEPAKAPVARVAGLLSCWISRKPPLRVIGRLPRMLPPEAWTTKCPASIS